MTFRRFSSWLAPFLAAALLASCAPAVKGSSGDSVAYLSTGSGGASWSGDLGSTPRDLYLVFTNTSGQTVSGTPALSSASFAPDAEAATANASRSVAGAAGLRRGTAIHLPADFWEAKLPSLSALKSGSRSIQARSGTAGPNADVAGTSAGSFYDLDSSFSTMNRQVAAHCRYATSGLVDMGNGDSRKLSIWVDDAYWSAISTDPTKVTQAMVDKVAEWFIGSSADRGSSIYRWETDMIGKEWGETSYSNLIPYDKCITIFITSIGAQDSPSGGVVGYFSPENNIATDTYSNKRIMFTIDALMLSNPNSDGADAIPSTSAYDYAAEAWSPSAYWPAFVHSTLTHEFQHMIDFYQKSILRDVTETTWANEMCSMCVEDLLADKIGVNGPRGLGASASTYDYGPGSAGNFDGRIPGYNEYDESGLSSSWSLYSSDPAKAWIPYSLSYAFGAYLIRNYGGPAFMERMLQSSSAGTQSVVAAANAATGGSDDFAQLYRRFAAAVLLSPSETAPALLRFNAGSGGFSFTSDAGDNYRLGSIDFSNYSWVSSGAAYDGPFLRTPSSLKNAAKMPGYAQLYVRIGSKLSGNQSFSIDLPSGVAATLVSLPSQ